MKRGSPDTPSKRSNFLRRWAKNCIEVQDDFDGFFVHSGYDSQDDDKIAIYNEVKDFWLVGNSHPISTSCKEHKAIFLLMINEATK